MRRQGAAIDPPAVAWRRSTLGAGSGSSRWVALLILGLSLAGAADSAGGEAMDRDAVNLPAPRGASDFSLEEALAARRSCREFAARPLVLAQLSQLLWAAYGITGRQAGYELKTAPSGGALYPLEILVAVGEGSVTDLGAGVYRYRPSGHTIAPAVAGDRRAAIARACLRQEWMAEAPVILIIAGIYKRSTGKYGDRGVRYAHMEAGHAAQNVCLQAEALGLGAGIVGAFEDLELARVLNLAAAEDPLLALPVGHRR